MCFLSQTNANSIHNLRLTIQFDFVQIGLIIIFNFSTYTHISICVYIYILFCIIIIHHKANLTAISVCKQNLLFMPLARLVSSDIVWYRLVLYCIHRLGLYSNSYCYCCSHRVRGQWYQLYWFFSAHIKGNSFVRKLNFFLFNNDNFCSN